MTDEHIVRSEPMKKPKGILKGEDHGQDINDRVLGDDLRGVVLDMKRMLDRDLAPQA